jgi:hypothetical protein
MARLSKKSSAGADPVTARSRPGHGGKRPGAGRKKKDFRSPTALAAIDLKRALDAPVPADIETAAQQHAWAAVSALVAQLSHGLSDAARINAANEILDRGYGKPALTGSSTSENAAGGTGNFLLATPWPSKDSNGVTGDNASEDQITAPVRTEARKFANLAIEVLHRVAIASESESARVSAAKSLLARGLGVAERAKVPNESRRAVGKKEAATEAAKAADAGIYRTPPPPGRVIQ